MTTAPLRHLTLNTGHMRLSHRAEVDDLAIDILLPVVDAGGGPMGASGWTLTVLHRSDGWAAYQIGPQHEPWVIAVACWHADTAQPAWSNMRALAKAAVLPPDWQAPPQPETPWVAAAIIPFAMTLDQDAIEALGDAERCIAWAIIESEGHNDS